MSTAVEIEASVMPPMDNRNLTVEQLQAIERWENEGGKITPALRFMAGSQPGEMRNEQSALRKLSFHGRTAAGRRWMYGQGGGWYNEAQ